MQLTFSPRIALLLATTAAVATFAGAARAQMGGAFDPNALMRQGAAQAPNTYQAPKVQPPALPGAASTEAVAPATRIPTDMSPNDALFDAINRGDISAARDALNRGAELGAHNVLGMTPLELSVDLGRNDISFLLLSFREADGGGAPAAQAAGHGAKAAAAASKPATPVKAAAGKPARRGAVVAVKDVVPPAPARTPQLFSGDGGTPVPNDGFLGFNAGQPSH